MQTIDFDPVKQKARWVAYFDLLGTSIRIQKGDIYPVFSAYRTACEELSKWRTRHRSVLSVWFSDTFVLYTKDDSGQSFAAIEMVARWFAFALIQNQIPVRGSIACGELYADPKNDVYLGNALVESYQWGEAQVWLGFILTPSAVTKLESLKLPIEERLNYRYHPVFFKIKGRSRKKGAAACLLGNWIYSGDRKNPLLSELIEMRKSQKDSKIVRKYDRTIAFLQQYERKP
jgi:hypothetical protein